jgi:hypothetical protein
VHLTLEQPVLQVTASVSLLTHQPTCTNYIST